MLKGRKRKDREFDKNICAFCSHPPDEKNCGRFFTSNYGYSVHQYCMFFSAALPQNGKDDEGFEGFLEQDVLKEIRRASRLRCYLCSKKGASAGCCDQNCKKSFHFSCGFKQKYLFQFFGQFRAYCCDHRLHQTTESFPSKRALCPICLESVPCCVSPDVLTTPCCKDVWFHRSCVQEQAKTSGYFFRCAVCNDTEKFVQEMKRMGIYVPDRDAAWEDGNNFAELLEKYSHCDCVLCNCPKGRKFSADSGEWELILCSSCGQYGAHLGCKNWTTHPPSLLCPTCRPAHEVSKPTALIADPLPLDPGGADEIVCRKGRGNPSRGGRKRQHQDSDEDSDDLANVLNGLKRQAEDDFLNSDTKFFVRRAIAAGTAVTEHSGLKKCKTRQSDSESSNFSVDSQNRIPEKAPRILSSEASDDDIVITKYVPGQRLHDVCPKCNRRRRTKYLAAETPRRISPTGSTSTGGKTGSTCMITKADVERKEGACESPELNTSGYSLPGFKSSGHESPAIETRCSDAEGAREVKVSDYEVLEFAAEQTDKSSVLLLSTEEISSGSAEKDDVSKDVNENVISVVNNLDDCRKASVRETKASSFWLSSVDRLFRFFNPRPSVESKQDSNSGTDVRKTPEESWQASEELRKLLRECQQTSGVTRTHSDCLRRGASAIDPTSAASAQGIDVTLWLTSPEKQPLSSESVGNMAQTIGEGSECVGKTSNRAETSSNAECVAGLSDSLTNVRNGYQFSSNKAGVVEAAMDRALELRRNGNELKHRCLSSS